MKIQHPILDNQIAYPVFSFSSTKIVALIQAPPAIHVDLGLSMGTRRMTYLKGVCLLLLTYPQTQTLGLHRRIYIVQ